LAYTARVKSIPAGTQRLDLWLPVPHSDAFQQIANVEVHCSYPHQTFVDGLGNRILHIPWITRRRGASRSGSSLTPRGANTASF
jgi:hypothetical protein